MRFRKLRIAFSATCLIACVLLIVLWARSYCYSDVVWNINKNFVQTSFGSTSGVVYLYRNHRSGASSTIAIPGGGFATEVILQTSGWKHISDKPTTLDSMFKWESIGTATMIHLPNWLLVFSLSFAGTIPWMRWRFTLRTLLIATTLVAVVLGIIIALSR